MKIYLAQINTTVGDFEGNLSLIRKNLKAAQKLDTDLVVFPELCLTGYPPLDLLNYKSFAERSMETVSSLVAEVNEPAALVGYVEKVTEGEGSYLYNSAALLHNKRVEFNQRKMLLPTYDVFDEKRYFDPGIGSGVINFKGKRLGITICEDIWNDKDFWQKQRYEIDPVEMLAESGVDLIINISASPFNIGKMKLRYDMVRSLSLKYRIPFILVNSIGGNTELVFDGTSMVFDSDGRITNLLKSFEEDSALIDTDNLIPLDDYAGIDMPSAEQAYQALILGVRDYFLKCGFNKAVLGLSGGIDSAVTACIAVDALGPENVLAVIMPTRYTAEASLEDARILVKNLGIDWKLMSIDKLYQAYLDFFADEFGKLKKDVTEENFQARIRGNVLMGFSNKYGHLLLTTGNKSELAVGYCTLYGDMSGGLAVLSDVPKTMVYEIARLINKKNNVIPEGIMTRAPSAELRKNQTDQDTLPPYDQLDNIIQLYVEEEKDLEEIVKTGMDRELARKIIRMIDNSEFKRKQAPPGLKITGRAFGFGRRMPIVQKYHR